MSTSARETGAPVTASQRILAEVTRWPGVRVAPGERGELSIRFGSREIGHLHGDGAAHFSFPRATWQQLRAEGRIVHHPVFPQAMGPAARAIRSDADVLDVIALLRLNYDRYLERFGLP